MPSINPNLLNIALHFRNDQTSKKKAKFGKTVERKRAQILALINTNE